MATIVVEVELKTYNVPDIDALEKYIQWLVFKADADLPNEHPMKGVIFDVDTVGVEVLEDLE